MAQERGFRPTIELLLAPELVAAAQASPVLTPSQLHVLQQQITALRRINVQLRVLKSRARTGAEPTAPRVPSGGGRGRGRGRATYDGGMIVVSGSGRGRGRGRGRGKRGREDESEEDDSIVARSSEEEEEEAVGSDSSEEEGMLSDEYESADSSESEEDYSLPAVAQPRRTGRMRRPSSAASLLADALRSEGGEDGGSSSGEEEVEGRRQQQQQRGAPEPAGPDEEQQGQQGSAAPARQDNGGTAAPTSSGGAQRRGLFMVVSEDTTSASGAIHLPQLQPVEPPKPGRAAAAGEEEDGAPVKLEEGAEQPGEEEEEEEEVACDVCGDAEAVEGNVILLCEGKGCNVAVHQQCYGVHKVPEGKWLCEACKAKLKPGAAHCCVCPVVGGAVKKVASLGRVVPASSGSSGGKGKGKGGSKGPPPVFCHLACALWVPEIEFADHEHMAGVRLDRMTRLRAKLRCEICKQAGGAAVQCAFGTCCRSFHVLCGRAAGQQLTFRATDGEPLAFCELHSRPAFEKMVEEYVDGKRSLELRGQPADGEDGEGGAADSGG